MNTPATLEGIILPPAEEGGALVQVADALSPLDLFTTPTLVYTLVDHVKALALDGYAPDLSTDKGRKAIASRAFIVAKTKTYLDDLGKAEVARLKELPKLVDDGRRVLRERLDALRDEIRQPLTAWETQQDKLKAALTDLRNMPTRMFTATAAQLRKACEDLAGDSYTPEFWGDFLAEAESNRQVVLSELRELLEKAEKFEADAAELARLRAEKEAREKAEREEALRREGEARALAAQQTAAAPAPDTPPQTGPTGAPTPAPVPAPLPPPGTVPPQPAAVQLHDDLEHRRAFNREALADLLKVTAGDEDVAKAILGAIVRGQVRHISIAY